MQAHGVAVALHCNATPAGAPEGTQHRRWVGLHVLGANARALARARIHTRVRTRACADARAQTVARTSVPFFRTTWTSSTPFWSIVVELLCRRERATVQADDDSDTPGR
jgi:hypothetical protein